ncbi:MAG: RIP metalloprotease RseP [Xanthomonadales bacterium]|nr:RIP metalloprotease RseP [Xanthomonadales bacterium]
MLEVLGSIWWLLVALGVLITFHEFGHYWVARRLGVKVLRFSVGFGRALWKRNGRDGTEYMVAALPLGGYVKMLDEREGPVAQEELDQAFNRQSVWSRIAIVSAGPAFNLLFAVLAFWAMFMVGIPEARPVVGEVSGIAAVAGIRPEDEIIAVDGDRTATWSHTVLGLVTHALDRDRIEVTVEQPNGARRNVTLDLAQLGDDFSEENTLQAIGLQPWRAVIPAEIGEVSPESPADQAGLRAGDRVIRIGGEDVPDWSWLGFLVKKHGAEGQPVSVVVERGGAERTFAVTPREEKEGWFSSRLVLGITNVGADEATRTQLERAYVLMRHGPVAGLTAAFSETWRLTHTTIGLLGRMITGSASVKNLSGPISIAQFANDSANSGLSSFLFFLGLISLSLGILNLLPIPVLDGGHLLYYLIELVKGSPVSEQVQLTGQYVGLVALFGLMSLAFVNDILRLVG